MPALQALCDHVIARHYPQATGPADLLRMVMARQADLMAAWAAVGFIHGVMNTDNMAVSGETIDYGPCAFLDGYHPDTVFSAIDEQGRYAYANQPRIALWNIAQFATALVALMPDQDAAIADFTAIINSFPAIFDAADFTNTFDALGRDTARDQFLNRDGFDAWQARWQARGPVPDLMAKTNPRVIPRTHLIEAAIRAGTEGDLAPFHAMLAAVTAPFDGNATYEKPPLEDERVRQTFCGT